MKDFRQLAVWQRAHRLALEVYRVSAAFPREELFGLTSQMRRAATSIPANIAEGCGRDGDAELARFLQIGMGSASELEYHLILARDIGLLAEHDHHTLAAELVQVKRMLTAFILRLRTAKSPKPDC